MRIKKKTLFWLVFFLVIYIVISCIEVADLSKTEQIACYRRCGMFAIVLFVLQLWSLKSTMGRIVSPYVIFLASFACFCSGQAMVYAFYMEEFIETDIAKITSYSDVLRATYLSMQCLVAFHCGALLFLGKGAKHKRLEMYEDGAVRERAAIYSVGSLIFFVTFIPMFLFTAYLLVTAMDIGYLAINDRSSSTLITKIMSYVSLYFQCSAVLCLVGSRNNKRRFDRYLLAVAVYAASMLMMGERTEPTAQLIFAFWLRSKYFGAAKKSQYLPLVVLVLALFIIFPAIMKNRYGGLITMDVLITAVRENNIFSILAESIAALGYSIFPLTMTMNIVPSAEPYRYGITYLAALTGVIPFLGIANRYAGLGTWLKKELSMSYGPGFSIPAEVYINFGPYVFVPMLVIGLLMAKFLHFEGRDGKINYTNLMVSGMVLITQVTLPRREFLGAVRDIFYVMIPIYLAVRHICRKREDKDDFEN